MKHLSLILLLGSLLCIKSKAQEFQYGVIVGADLTNIRITDWPSEFEDGIQFKYTPSFHINGFVGYKISESIGFTLEPGYIAKGSLAQGDETTKDDDLKWKLSYIQAPLLFNYYFNDKIYASAGPEFAYLLKAKVKGEYGTGDITESVKRTEISGILGINYILNDHFDIGARYSRAFTKFDEITLVDDDGRPIGKSIKHYNHYFQLLVKIQF